MPRQLRWVQWLSAVVICVCFALIGTPNTPAAAAPLGGWHSPLPGSSPAAGWLANECGHPEYGHYGNQSSNGPLYHVGRDYWGAAGAAVHAIGNGVVVRNADFGDGSRALFVKHRAVDGTEFLVLYGHITTTLAANAPVRANDIVGRLAQLSSGPHLHLGVLPKLVIPANNWGHIACNKWQATNDFVDPVTFLDAHPGGATANLADGTFLAERETGTVYRIVGGAPIKLTNHGPLLNGAPVTWLPKSSISKLPAHPRDGVVVSLFEAGGSALYRFAGGAPIRLFNWGAIADCCGSVITVNAGSLAAYDHMHRRPKDGTVISIAEAGGAGIYRFVGGAPIRLYDWGVIDDCCDKVVIVNAESLARLDHMNAVPNDGAMISLAEAGGAGIYRFIGGAPMRLFDWGSLPDCCQQAVTINAASLANHDHMHTRPTDGKFIASKETGVVYRTAGGAALRLYNWGGIPGCCDSLVWVNQQTINTLDHLNAIPANGTVLQANTTGAFWLIGGGKKSPVSARQGAVIVDDQTIAALP